MAARGLVLLTASVVAAQDASDAAPKGPYKTSFQVVKDVAVMDKSSQKINVWFPKGKEGQKFPLISYAHGLGGGGVIEPIAYTALLKAIAEFGYVIVAPDACDFGCSDLATLPLDPPGFKHYYLQQLKAIEWARNQTDGLFSTVDFSVGVGIAGHSMGGQATVYSSSEAGAGHDIRAAVMHHAFTHSYPAPVVPFLAFTGTKDTTAPPKMSQGFFGAERAHPVKGLVNKVGATHHEPDITDYNPKVAPFSAAWFKIFLDKTPQADGFDYHDMVFGSGANSLCGGGDGDMQQCELHDAAGSVIV